jgi:hypothetical protein
VHAIYGQSIEVALLSDQFALSSRTDSRIYAGAFYSIGSFSRLVVIKTSHGDSELLPELTFRCSLDFTTLISTGYSIMIHGIAGVMRWPHDDRTGSSPFPRLQTWTYSTTLTLTGYPHHDS